MILIGLSSIFATCRRNPLPDPNSFYFIAKLNGQDYVPSNCANCLKAQVLGDTVFLMNANAGFETILVGVTKKPSFIIGNYTLNSPSSGGAYKNSTTPTDRYDTDATRTGQLVITEVDKVNKIVAGTFYFQAYNPVQNATVNITEGSFRLQYQE